MQKSGRFVWLVEDSCGKVEWKCSYLVNGVLCHMMELTLMMLELCVDSWAIAHLYSECLVALKDKNTSYHSVGHSVGRCYISLGPSPFPLIVRGYRVRALECQRLASLSGCFLNVRR